VLTFVWRASCRGWASSFLPYMARSRLGPRQLYRGHRPSTNERVRPGESASGARISRHPFPSPLRRDATIRAPTRFPKRLEVMIGPKPRQTWTQFATKQQLLAALGKRLREEIPDDSVQLHPADHRQRHRGHQRHVRQPGRRVHGRRFERLARPGASHSRLTAHDPRRDRRQHRARGAAPQLVILPDRALCAQYNVRVDDVTNVINTALGGDPIGILLRGRKNVLTL